MNTIDRLLDRMFIARRVCLSAGAVLVGLIIILDSGDRAGLLTERGELVLLAGPILVALVVTFIAMLLTGFYVFRTGLHEVGLGYATGHLLLCLALNIMGIIFVPLQIRSDVDRWRRSEGDLPDDSGGE
jgi:hypothetical protein